MLGKLSHVSGLLVVMRPFMEPVWKAWGSPSPEEKPGCIWRAQIQTELDWFTAFFNGNGTSVERFFSVDAYNTHFNLAVTRASRCNLNPSDDGDTLIKLRASWPTPPGHPAASERRVPSLQAEALQSDVLAKCPQQLASGTPILRTLAPHALTAPPSTSPTGHVGNQMF